MPFSSSPWTAAVTQRVGPGSTPLAINTGVGMLAPCSASPAVQVVWMSFPSGSSLPSSSATLVAITSAGPTGGSTALAADRSLTGTSLVSATTASSGSSAASLRSLEVNCGASTGAATLSCSSYLGALKVGG